MLPISPRDVSSLSMRRSLVAALSRAASASLSQRVVASSSMSMLIAAPRLIQNQHPRGLLVVAAAEARADGRKQITKKALVELDAAPAVRKRRTAKEIATSEIEAPSSTSEITSSAPPPIDLRACLPEDPAPFARVRRWILFSDLHVCDRTVDASVAALAAVRNEARRLQREIGGGASSVGVAFLGDFWHARGSIPVRPLNAVLEEMAKWEGIPLLMLVGNHDQVTAGGTEHALEAVAAAASAAGAPAHVFDRPALFLGALWLPYRRDPAELSAAIASAAAAAAAEPKKKALASLPLLPPSVVFAHTDVLGAAANDAYQCDKGLEPSAFPARAWLGHYHKPHVVGGEAKSSSSEDSGDGDVAVAAEKALRKKSSRRKKKTLDAAIVEYVGSPYQVSRAEAGQQKALVVLEGLSASSSSDSSSLSSDAASFHDFEIRHDWGELARVPLDVGPRHFELRGLEPEAPEGLRPGDRVRWILPEGASPADADARASLLRSSTGADVELHLPPPPSAAPRLAPAEAAAGPHSVFKAYADHVGMSDEARIEGEAVLDAVGAGSSSGKNDSDGVTLSLLSVRVEGFGPFVSAAEYDLSAGGVRVLTGRNVDAGGGGGNGGRAVDAPADSNGAGKTSLAMSAHWAITGRSDARADGGGGRGLTHSDVVNDRCDSASVVVTGTILKAREEDSGESDGGSSLFCTEVPFELERAVSRKKLLRLRLAVGGEDLTGADARLTQAAIDELLGAPLISRASFLGQADAMSLLEAGDAELKSELSKVALDGDAWDAAKLESSTRLRAARARGARAAASLEAAEAQVESLKLEVEDARAAAKAWEEEQRTREQERDTELERARGSSSGSQGNALFFRELREASAAAEASLKREISDARSLASSLGRWLRSKRKEKEERLPLFGHETFSEDSFSEDEMLFAEAGARSYFSSSMSSQQQQRETTMTSTTGARQQQQLRHPVPHPSAFIPSPPSQRQQRDDYSGDVAPLAATAAALAEQATTAAAALGAADAAARAALVAAREYQALATQQQQPQQAPPPLPPLPPPPAPPAHLQPWQQQQWQQQWVQQMQQQRMQQQLQQQQLQPRRILAPVCDRCLQPVSRPAFESNLARLRRVAEETALARQRAASAATAARARAEQAQADADAAAARALEKERREASERERAAKIEAEEAELLARVDEAAAAASRAAERHAGMISELSSPSSSSFDDEPSSSDSALFDADASAVRELASRAHLAASSVEGAAAALAAARAEVASAEAAAAAAAAAAAEAAAAASNAATSSNPHAERCSAAERLLSSAQGQASLAREESALASGALAVASEVDAAFGSAGARSLALEGALAELQRRTQGHLDALSPGTALHLSATRAPASGSAAAPSPREIERITKSITVRTTTDGGGDGNNNAMPGFVSRSLRALSGGERRRVALAFALGFADLAAARGRLSCDLLVLDEVLQHLDDAGCAAVARLLRTMVSTPPGGSRGGARRRTVVVVAQAASFAEREFDAIDVVVKEGGVAKVVGGASVGV